MCCVPLELARDGTNASLEHVMDSAGVLEEVGNRAWSEANKLVETPGALFSVATRAACDEVPESVRATPGDRKDVIHRRVVVGQQLAAIHAVMTAGPENGPLPFPSGLCEVRLQRRRTGTIRTAHRSGLTPITVASRIAPMTTVMTGLRAKVHLMSRLPMF